LFLAKRIAELHGGELSVESKPGNGARFLLSLPCQLHAVEEGNETRTPDGTP
jgi:signal transduction histidine kinase